MYFVKHNYIVCNVDTTKQTVVVVLVGGGAQVMCV